MNIINIFGYNIADLDFFKHKFENYQKFLNIKIISDDINAAKDREIDLKKNFQIISKNLYEYSISKLLKNGLLTIIIASASNEKDLININKYIKYSEILKIPCFFISTSSFLKDFFNYGFLKSEIDINSNITIYNNCKMLYANETDIFRFFECKSRTEKNLINDVFKYNFAINLIDIFCIRQNDAKHQILTMKLLENSKKINISMGTQTNLIKAFDNALNFLEKNKYIQPQFQNLIINVEYPHFLNLDENLISEFKKNLDSVLSKINLIIHFKKNFNVTNEIWRVELMAIYNTINNPFENSTVENISPKNPSLKEMNDDIIKLIP